MPEFHGRNNKLRVEANVQSGLRDDSAADFLQIRSVSVERLLARIGVIDAQLVQDIVAGVALALDYQPGQE